VLNRAPGVNITTIYRTLELLEELNLVTHVHLSHGAPTYHDINEERHVHLVCRNCEHVQELDPEELGPLAARLAEERGFRLDIAHVALFGLCKGCSS
jgi:Fur family ferric uptake transcriptional regulator